MGITKIGYVFSADSDYTGFRYSKDAQVSVLEDRGVDKIIFEHTKNMFSDKPVLKELISECAGYCDIVVTCFDRIMLPDATEIVDLVKSAFQCREDFSLTVADTGKEYRRTPNTSADILELHMLAACEDYRRSMQYILEGEGMFECMYCYPRKGEGIAYGAEKINNNFNSQTMPVDKNEQRKNQNFQLIDFMNATEFDKEDSTTEDKDLIARFLLCFKKDFRDQLTRCNESDLLMLAGMWRDHGLM